MNQVIQGDDSGAPSVLPAKQGRGRPRKETNLKQVKTEREPPGFEGAKGKRPHKVDSMDGYDNMVGQAVAGVVEATFGAGYVLNVRIGNSNTTLRGVVLKPGHYIPVTDENDIAPHVQMIRRKDIQFWAQNRTLQTGGTAGANLKYASPKVVSSVPPVGARGTVVPDVLSFHQVDSHLLAKCLLMHPKLLLCYHLFNPYLLARFRLSCNPNLGTKLHKKVCRMKMLHQKMAPPRLKKEKRACNQWNYRWQALQDHQRFRTKMVRMLRRYEEGA